MNPCDEGYRGGHDRETHDVAEGVNAASPLGSRDSADKHVVDGNLTEDYEHEGNGDAERAPARGPKHRCEENDLERDHECKHRPDRIVVHQISNDELAKGGNGEHHKGVPSHEGCRHRQLGKAFIEDLGQRESCALEDEPPDRSREEDDDEHTGDQAPVHRYRIWRFLGLDTKVGLHGDFTPVRVQEPGIGDPGCN